MRYGKGNVQNELGKNTNYLLYQLGLTANYRGFFYVSYAMELSIEKEERLLLVTKWLYPEVAKGYGTNWKAMERSIRTVGHIMWRENRPLLEELAGRRLEEQPQTAQLLAILAAAVKKKGRKRNAHSPDHAYMKKSNKVASADSGEGGIRVNGFLIHLSAQEECVGHEVVHDSGVALGVAVEGGKSGGLNDSLGAAGANQLVADIIGYLGVRQAGEGVM